MSHASLVGGHVVANSYWIWAGIEETSVPPSDELYVYQGNFFRAKGNLKFERKGLFPYPARAKKVVLVYGLRMLPDVNLIMSVYKNHQERWLAHSVVVVGIQLDFDSPTQKISAYADYLAKVRAALPKNHRLSITGLCDWVNGSPPQLQKLRRNVDEIVFQLYQSTSHVKNARQYIRALEQLKQPYKLGMLFGKALDVELGSMSYLSGIIYFVQRRS